MDGKERAAQIYQQFKDHLDSHQIHYTPHDEDQVLTLTAQGEDLPMPVVIHVIAEREVVKLYSPLPCDFPEDKRVDAALAVCSLNNKLMNGTFDLDIGDGSVSFRLCQSFHDNDISEVQIRYMMVILFKTVDEYNDSLFALAKGLMSLEQFFEKTQN